MAASEIDIEAVGPDGAGRGRWRHKEAVVPGTLAAERIAVEWTHVGRRRAFGRVRRVLKAAPERVPPRCPHFERCGGCDLLHVSRDHQLQLKRSWLEAILGRSVEPVRRAPAGFAYRALAKLVVGSDGRLGSYAPRSHEVVSMDGCLIHMPVIEALADRLRSRWSGAPPPGLRFVVIRARQDGAGFGVSLVAAADGPRPDTHEPAWLDAIDLIAEDERACWVELRRKARADDVVLSPEDERRRRLDRRALLERIGPVELRLEPDGFAQVHPAMAGAMFAYAVAEIGAEGAAVADLYAGSAVLGRWALHEGAASAVAVEPAPGGEGDSAERDTSVPPWVETDPRLRFVRSRTEDAFEVYRSASHVFVNPPRKGLGPAVVEGLLAARARRIVYVSCGPSTLAEDLRALQAGFEITRVQPFDLFPQTRHVETVVSLSRR